MPAQFHRSPVIVAGEKGGYGKGVGVTEARGFVWLAGSVGIDVNTGKVPEKVGEQARLAMENIKDRLAEFGTSLKNIVFWRRYVVGDFPNGIVSDPMYQEINSALQDFWKENYPEFLRENNPPASTLVGVTALARPEFKVEIEVIAAIV